LEHRHLSELLLERGADVNITTHRGFSPLWLAADRNDVSFVEILLNHGAAINHQIPEEELSSLYLAVSHGNASMVALLLKRGADANLAACDGSTPLLHAAEQGYLSIVELLLDYGANLDIIGPTDLPPLYEAAINGHLDVVRLLLEHGADLHFEDVAEIIDDIDANGYFEISNLLSSCQEAKEEAEEGHVEFFVEEVKAGTLAAPILQWEPHMPRGARRRLSAWISSSLTDSSACYAALFRPIASPGKMLLRASVAHDGMHHIPRLILSFLVYPNADTRRIICEMAACGMKAAPVPVRQRNFNYGAHRKRLKGPTRV
jgi:hypothetical protein